MDMVTKDGFWNLDLFCRWLPEDMGPKRVRFFIWMALKERFLTNVEHMGRGLGSSSSCGFCGHDFEDVLHVIRDCSIARDIWLQGISWSIDEVIKVSYSWAKHYVFDCKGVMRDTKGNWILGFSKFLEICSVLEAELW
ncbi:hypothetical protein Gorai_002889, partial [Gossypium raimondii]|nr:hypothetical protein [Gossypium raimondii]